ncbi:hypothetical protein, partial [Raoultella ornithinolytica]|uniref:hypothetical protein n=1 Tax=Raoultella ornithinolytica TaxID=54291 RepID=UPI001966E682
FPDSGINPWPGLRTGPSRSPGKRRATGECSWITEDELFAVRPVRQQQRCARGIIRALTCHGRVWWCGP